MLRLERRKGEKVDLIIEGRIVATVTVCEINLPGDRIRLGFDALPEVSILRDNAKVREEVRDDEHNGR